MKVTRRNFLLCGAAGATAGLVFSPVPWKLLDDSSIWSQNWPWILQPAHAPVEVKQSFCTLCPKGCAVRVRTAAGWPIGVAGVSRNPLTRGALCPLGFAAHQLNWHPQRLRSVLHHTTASSWDAAREAFTKACSEGPVVVLDGYPGRAASALMASFAEKRKGSYRVVPGPELRSLTPYQEWSGVSATALGYDFGNARTVVSFGAPLLESWGLPGSFHRVWAERSAGMRDPELRLIQIEAAVSPTGSRAWREISILPGSEGALASGLARVLLEEHLVPARGPMPNLTLDESARQSGLNPEKIRNLARTIAAQLPVIAVANDDPQVAALNIVLGAVGERGGIVQKTASAKSYAWAADEIQNARAVLVDSSVPWDFTPHTDAEVFRFAAWDGGFNKGDWLLPAPGFLEELTDVPSAPALAFGTYAVAMNLTSAAHQTQSAAQFLAALDASLGTTEQIIHARCADLFLKGVGNVHAQEVTPVGKFESAQKLEEMMGKGAVWIGELGRSNLRCALKLWPSATLPKAIDTSSGWTVPVLPPLASKLFQESDLRPAGERRNA
jgi:hypothetical protein